MSKHIRVKLTCEIEFDLSDLNEDVASEIREAEGIDDYDAIEESHIVDYLYAQDVYELSDQFGIVDADIEEVIVE